MRFSTLLVAVVLPCAYAQQEPNLKAQHDALNKLAFLVGKWSGDATIMTRGGEIKVRQSEDVQIKLDGLVMLVEGTGRDPETGKVLFNALATISYDEPSGLYRFRSYNAGRYLDTELKVLERGFEWGYDAGPTAVRFKMKLDEKGEWVETGEVKIGSNPPRRTVDMRVKREN